MYPLPPFSGLPNNGETGHKTHTRAFTRSNRPHVVSPTCTVNTAGFYFFRKGKCYFQKQNLTFYPTPVPRYTASALPGRDTLHRQPKIVSGRSSTTCQRRSPEPGVVSRITLPPEGLPDTAPATAPSEAGPGTRELGPHGALRGGGGGEHRPNRLIVFPPRETPLTTFPVVLAVSPRLLDPVSPCASACLMTDPSLRLAPC